MIDWKALAAPFAPTELEWRVGQKSKDGKKASLLCYLTARAVMQRLDDVVGPARWSDAYQPLQEGEKTVGYLCTLSIEVAPGEWVAKTDGADTTDIEALKGGLSSALKRAAVRWGIGRYLYDLDARYHPILEGYGPDGSVYCPIGSGPGHIVPPKLPAWALPAPRPAPVPAEPAPAPSATTAALELTAWKVELAARGFDLEAVAALAKHLDRPPPDQMAPHQRRKFGEWLQSETGQTTYYGFLARTEAAQ